MASGRTPFSLLVLVCWWLQSAACTPSLEPPIGDGDTLIVALEAGPRNLLPVLAQSPLDAMVAANLQFSLFDVGFSCGLTFEPALALRWEFSDGGRALSVWLRDDIRWSDGQLVTAADVARAMAVAGDAGAESAHFGLIDELVPGAAPKVLSPTELRFEFKRPAQPERALAQIDAVGVLPAHHLTDPGLDGAALRSHTLNRQAPVVSGPWSLESWTESELRLERNKAFTGPDSWRPHLARLVFRVLPDRQARHEALERGEVDLVSGIPATEVEALEERVPNVQIRRRGWRDLEMVVWNTRISAPNHNPLLEGPRAPLAPHPLFGDAALRRALAAGIDTDRMIRELYTGELGGEAFARPAVGTLSPALCGVHNDKITRIPHDPAAGRAALALLGWEDRNADGWLDKGGEPLRFRLVYNSGNPRSEPVIVRLREDLATLGADALVEGVEGPAFVDRLRRGDFDAALTTWTASLYADPESRWGRGAEHNFGRFEDDAVERLLEEARLDPAASVRVAQAVQDEVYRQQPAAFLYWVGDLVGVDARFHDTEIGLLSPAHRLHRWWVPADKRKRP